VTPLTLPEVEHEHFEHSPLKSMLGQVRFPPILRLSERAFISAFQDALRADYPELQREDEVGLALSEDASFRTETSRRWRLVGRDGWVINLAPEFVTLQVDPASYTDYTEFRGRFTVIWEQVLEHFPPPSQLSKGSDTSTTSRATGDRVSGVW
jgi:uncharacterized protein (TIGR04255 family)